VFDNPEYLLIWHLSGHVGARLKELCCILFHCWWCQIKGIILYIISLKFSLEFDGSTKPFVWRIRSFRDD
jgi:hypothetical protein